MTLKFDLSVRDADEVRDDLERMGERARTPAPVFNRIADLMYAGISRQFGSQGDFGGEPWSKLSAETVERRGDHPALATLRGTFTRRKVLKTKVSVGSAHPLVRIHQGGATEGRRGDLPARPMAVLSTGLTRRLVSMLTEYLVPR